MPENEDDLDNSEGNRSGFSYGKPYQKAGMIVISVIGMLLIVAGLWYAAQDYLAYMSEIGLLQGQVLPARVVLGLVALESLLGGILFWISWLIWQPRQTIGITRLIIQLRTRWRWLAWVFAGLVVFIPLWLLQHTVLSGAFGYSARVILGLGIGTTVAALTSRHQEKLFQSSTLIAAWLVIASVFTVGQAFASVTAYPFSLTWSEGNRIWDYSVLFGQRFYNYPADQPIFALLDLGRQSLWGLPFLFGSVPIWVMRLWNALLSTLPYAILGWVAFKRLGKQVTNRQNWVWVLCGLWTLLFLTQGPIHTPLVLSAILVALAWRKSLWLAVPLIIVAGFYAQATRFTWIFAPAIWAALLFFADSNDPIPPRRRWTDAIAVFGAGLVGSILLPMWVPFERATGSIITETTPTEASGEILSLAGLADMINRQPLLWERLLPNPTYYPGILLGLLLATLPMILFLTYLVKNGTWKLDRWSKLALLAPASVFLLIGLVVSVKIGGGGDLHNMDMFLITLVFAAALAWVAGGYRAILNINHQPAWIQGVWIVMVFLFAQQALLDSAPIRIPAAAKVNEALTYIQNSVNNTSGEILFLDQRQLLTFKNVPAIPLVVDYEKKYLMDQAMAENAAYFEGFHRDLARQRFSLIISEPLKVVYKGQEYHFGDENDAWVKWVAEPILCYYEPIQTFREVRVEILVPRDVPLECPR